DRGVQQHGVERSLQPTLVVGEPEQLGPGGPAAGRDGGVQPLLLLVELGGWQAADTGHWSLLPGAVSGSRKPTPPEHLPPLPTGPYATRRRRSRREWRRPPPCRRRTRPGLPTAPHRPRRSRRPP